MSRCLAKFLDSLSCHKYPGREREKALKTVWNQFCFISGLYPMQHHNCVLLDFVFLQYFIVRHDTWKDSMLTWGFQLVQKGLPTGMWRSNNRLDNSKNNSSLFVLYICNWPSIWTEQSGYGSASVTLKNATITCSPLSWKSWRAFLVVKCLILGFISSFNQSYMWSRSRIPL